MKVAYLCNIFPSLSETFIYREVFLLRENGIQIKLYAIHKPDTTMLSNEAKAFIHETTYLLPVPIYKLIKSHFKAIIKNPKKYIFILYSMVGGDYSHFKQRLRGLMHFIEGVIFSEMLSQNNIRHIHSNFASQSTSIARAASMFLDISYSFSAHAYDIWKEQLLLPEKINEAKFVCCCTKLGVDYLKTLAKNSEHTDKIHLIYHGIDIRKYSFPSNDSNREKALILSVGRLSEKKGFPDLITAISMLKSRNIIVKAIIVGEGDQRNIIENLIISKDLSNQITLVGSLPQEKVISLYYKAWIFALPCINTKDGDKDGIPNVLLEAMATGVPVVTTTNSAQSELIEHKKSGMLVPPSNPFALSNSLEIIVKDQQFRKLLILEARKRVEAHFDSMQTIKPMIGLFNNLNKKI